MKHSLASLVQSIVKHDDVGDDFHIDLTLIEHTVNPAASRCEPSFDAAWWSKANCVERATAVMHHIATLIAKPVQEAF